MFLGEFKHSLDSKNRLNIPSKWKEELGDVFYVTKGLDHCLFVFSRAEWKTFEEKLSSLPLTDKNSRAFARSFFAGATEIGMDRQGRILLPSNLKEYAGISKEVYINGAGSRIEIWDASAWERYNAEISEDMDTLAETMQMLGVVF